MNALKALHFDCAGDLLYAVPTFEKLQKGSQEPLLISCDKEHYSLLDGLGLNIQSYQKDPKGINIAATMFNHPNFGDMPLHVVIGKVLGVPVEISDLPRYCIEDYERKVAWKFIKVNDATSQVRIGIHFYSSGDDRAVLPGRRSELLEVLTKNFPEVKFFVFGTPKEYCREVISVRFDERLRHQIAIFSYMHYAICVDSLFNLMANLFKIPTLSMFTLINPATRLHGHVLDIKEGLNCVPCSGFTNCPERTCQARITVHTVLEETTKMLSKKPLVDILMPTWNTKAVTLQAIRYICEKTYLPFRLFVLDNRSEDDTFKALMYEFSKDRRITLIRKETNVGWVGGINCLMQERAANNPAPYVLWMNSDVFVTNDWLSRLLWHLEHEDYGAIGPKSNYVMWRQAIATPQPTNSPTMDWFADKLWFDHYHHSVETKLLIGFCLLMKSEVCEKIGLLDAETFGQGFSSDLDYSIRLGKAGIKMGIAEDCFVHHLGNVSFAEWRKTNTDQTYEEQLKEKDIRLRKKWGDAEVDNLFDEGDKLSVCIIALNEAKTLPKALENIHPIADEIIIGVDSRSTDNTLEVAHNFGQAFELNFVNFAQARNETLKRATGDWLLWADADDWVDAQAAYTIKGLTKRKDFLTAFAFSTALIDSKGVVMNQNSRVRLFRNRRGYHFEHFVHENVTLRGDNFGLANVTIKHGLLRSSHKGILEFEVELLKQEAKAYPTDVVTRLNLARALEAAGDLTSAEMTYLVILDRVRGYGEIAYMCNLQLTGLYQQAGYHPKALNYAHQTIRCAVLRAEGWSAAGLCYLEMGYYPQAEMCFRIATQCKIQRDGTLPVDPGLYSWKSWSNLGVALFSQGKFAEAIDVLEQAKSYVPSDPAINGNLDMCRMCLQKVKPMLAEVVKGVKRENIGGLHE